MLRPKTLLLGDDEAFAMLQEGPYGVNAKRMHPGFVDVEQAARVCYSVNGNRSGPRGEAAAMRRGEKAGSVAQAFSTTARSKESNIRLKRIKGITNEKGEFQYRADETSPSMRVVSAREPREMNKN
jgi:hypothetical protein